MSELAPQHGDLVLVTQHTKPPLTADVARVHSYEGRGEWRVNLQLGDRTTDATVERCHGDARWRVIDPARPVPM